MPPGPEQIVRLLLNDLVTLPHTALLVLDDYHLITLPAIHAALAVLRYKRSLAEPSQ